jgi:cytochrome c-type biogenesis protein CcmH
MRCVQVRRALVLLVALALTLTLGLAAPAFASEEHPTQSEMEAELNCPTCKMSLDMSDAPAAQDIKDYIRKRIVEGATKTEITDELVAQLGPGVRAVPTKQGFDLLAWLLPFLGIALGAVGLAAAAWYWSRVRRPGDGAPALATTGPSLEPELERRVDEELARFDA